MGKKFADKIEKEEKKSKKAKIDKPKAKKSPFTSHFKDLKKDSLVEK